MATERQKSKAAWRKRSKRNQRSKRSLRSLPSFLLFSKLFQVPKTLTFTEQPAAEMSPVWAVAAALLVGLAAGFALRSPSLKLYEAPQAGQALKNDGSCQVVTQSAQEPLRAATVVAGGMREVATTVDQAVERLNKAREFYISCSSEGRVQRGPTDEIRCQAGTRLNR